MLYQKRDNILNKSLKNLIEMKYKKFNDHFINVQNC